MTGAGELIGGKDTDAQEGGISCSGCTQSVRVVHGWLRHKKPRQRGQGTCSGLPAASGWLWWWRWGPGLSFRLNLSG